MDRKCLCFYRFWITLMEIFTLSVDPSVLSCSDRTNRSCPGCLFSPRMKTVALSASLSSDRPSASMQAGLPEAGYSHFVMMGPLLLWTWTPQHHRGSPWCLLMIWGFEPNPRADPQLHSDSSDITLGSSLPTDLIKWLHLFRSGSLCPRNRIHPSKHSRMMLSTNRPTCDWLYPPPDKISKYRPLIQYKMAARPDTAARWSSSFGKYFVIVRVRVFVCFFVYISSC